MMLYTKGYIMKLEQNREVFMKLLPEVSKDRGKPVNSFELTALLEIYGLRDIDAKTDYGYDNLFEMAKDMMNIIDMKEYPQRFIQLEHEKSQIKRITKHYIEGLAFAMPMIIQIMFTLVLGYAIWSSMDYDLEIATVIAVGTFLALVITGPTAQAIGRKGLYYLKLKEHALASASVRLLYLLGIGFVFIIAILLYIIQLFFHIFIDYYYLVMLAFFILLSVFFLNSSIYYMKEQHGRLLMHVIFGMLIVYLLHTVFQIKLPDAQFYTILIIDIEMTLLVFLKLRQMRKESETAEGFMLPKASIMFYSLVPFYTYGFLYFLFLILDRVLAWSVPSVFKPYFIWFNVPYELGLDWALISLVLLMGFTEAGIYEFMNIMNNIIGKYKYNESKKFSKKIKNFMRKFLIIYFISSILIMILVYYFIKLGGYYFDIEQLKIFLQEPTPFVFWIAAVSYIFLVGSLLNILFLFAMSRQTVPVKYILIGTLINLIVGLILSRFISYEYAVFGLLFGTIFLYFSTFNYTKKAIDKLDYFYYSAF